MTNFREKERNHISSMLEETKRQLREGENLPEEIKNALRRDIAEWTALKDEVK